MTNFRNLATVFIFSLFALVGCKEDSRLEPQTSATKSNASARQSASLSPELKARITQMRAALPAGMAARIQQNSGLLAIDHSEYRNMVLRTMGVIAPTPCDASNTPLNIWLNQQLAGWNEVIDNNGKTVFDYASGLGMLDFPTYDALFFVNSSDGQYFGVNGEYTKQTTKTFKDLKRFWNIDTDGMVLGAMHGSMLRDREKVIRIDKILYGEDQATAEYYADLIALLLEVVPQYRNGDHPIFTFNAFAQSSFFFPPVGVIPNKIIMGDGIVDAYVGIGYGDVASQAILAHEFGHQIQFQLDLFEEVDSPEATRRTELMADAYSAYYLSHARGATMQWKRVKQFLQVFFNIGDCSFSSDGHHGTPTQRMAAAEWGYSVADNAKKQGHILTAQEFTALFEAQLPVFITR